MNPHLRPTGLPLETQVAEGLPRRCRSVAEMVRAGIIDEDERIGGEVAPMSPKGVREVWVLDAPKAMTRVHRRLDAACCAEIVTLPGSARLARARAHLQPRGARRNARRG
ncbi:MAG TPA: hypothetical protein VIF40_12680 [Methylosinus sp.]|jgi:hypothetical protein|uniref:hypothetical protein n=1 Tax=Methylosinus sp. TaxID=427 RepID=UPI002F94EA67